MPHFVDPNEPRDLLYRVQLPEWAGTDVGLAAARRRRQLSGPRTDFRAMQEPNTPEEWGRAITERHGQNADRIAPIAPPEEPSLAGARKRRREKRVPFDLSDAESRAAHPVRTFFARTLGGPMAQGIVERGDARRAMEEARADAQEERRAEREREDRAAEATAMAPVPPGFVRVDGKAHRDPTYRQPDEEVELPEDMQDEFAVVGGRVIRRRERGPAMPTEEERKRRAEQGYWWDPQGENWRTDRSFVEPARPGSDKPATIPPSAMRGIITRHETTIRRIERDIQDMQEQRAQYDSDPDYNAKKIGQLDDAIEESTQTLDEMRAELEGMRNEYNAMKPKGPLQDMVQEFSALPADRQRTYLEQYRRPGT